MSGRCANFSGHRRRGGAAGDASGQEVAHQGDDQYDASGAVFDQHDEPFIGLLMGRIIVAVRGRVSHFAMVCHRYPQSILDLACKYRKAPGRATGQSLSGHSEGQLSRIQRVRLSSLTSPAARARMMAAASASGTIKSMPLTPRKVYSASSEVRLLPSTNG